ncbi:Transcriptional regulator, AraC family (fragment) [Xanthomonas citri pv. citri]
MARPVPLPAPMMTTTLFSIVICVLRDGRATHGSAAGWMNYACAAMVSSQSSKDDPLSQVLAALGARSAGLNRLEARGD